MLNYWLASAANHEHADATQLAASTTWTLTPNASSHHVVDRRIIHWWGGGGASEEQSQATHSGLSTSLLILLARHKCHSPFHCCHLIGPAPEWDPDPVETVSPAKGSDMISCGRGSKCMATPIDGLVGSLEVRRVPCTKAKDGQRFIYIPNHQTRSKPPTKGKPTPCHAKGNKSKATLAKPSANFPSSTAPRSCCRNLVRTCCSLRIGVRQRQSYCGWTKSCTRLKPWETIYKGIIILVGFLGWCRISCITVTLS